VTTGEWLFLAATTLFVAASVFFRIVKPWRAVRRDLEKLATGDHRLPPLTSDYAPYFESAAHIRKISTLLEQLDRQVVEEGLSLRAILAGMREGILLVNRSMRATLCNPALESCFPEIKKFLDRTVLEIFRRHELQHAVEQALRTGTAADLELLFDSRSFRIHISAITAENETAPRAALLVFQDITAMRALEAVRREFVANVSHEFRTPLTIIHGYVETLRDGALEDPAMTAKSLDAIHRNVQRLSLLLEDLLAISSLENRARPLDCSRADLHETARRAVEHLAPRIEERHASVHIDWPPEARFAEIDIRRIEQVFTNLLENALQHGESGELAIRIAARRTGNEIHITVEDNGAGIPLDAQPHIFERFYRVDKHRARDAGGTGLGLSIVKNILLAHGGSISVRSTPGDGTAFHIRLPVEQPKEPAK
jgi:two-component system, OmpR family, phosphate regulon sensor histidine kinase PhoR